ncbi:MAG: hypothetical protein HPY71_06820 [Firmicutes bacterium]|nr:hypothetical protein [Bacillota bacterium]
MSRYQLKPKARFVSILILAIALFLVTTVVVILITNQRVPANPNERATFSRSVIQDGVTIQVIFENPIRGIPLNKGVSFNISVTTHSGDLSDLNPANGAILRTSKGLTISEGFQWKWSSRSPHHPAGTLTLLPEGESSGKGVDLATVATAEWIELEIKSITGKEPMRFRWSLKSLD